MVFNDYDINVEKCDLPYNIDCTKRSKLRRFDSKAFCANNVTNAVNIFLETPRPTQNCPRLNGYFGHEDANVCDTFFYCVDGEQERKAFIKKKKKKLISNNFQIPGQANKITCPSGLVFNQKTGICTWADEAGKVGCSSEGEKSRTRSLK